MPSVIDKAMDLLPKHTTSRNSSSSLHKSDIKTLSASCMAKIDRLGMFERQNYAGSNLWH
ncbi:hypothetical protein T4C_1461 [Trichinella pseudospiralis]|uniref:Uncharacterized protein n=1 Tax=Trichinella pseudospiralis TaxID=6337 RepID=A0A0V1KBD6_TRIPS|nr:hypothetical protein T4C_1461 [Trichinella pseudospiralis]